MRQKIVAGNWKMNTTIAEGIELADKIIANIEGIDAHIVLCPPFTHLYAIGERLSKISCPVWSSKISLGAQNCADKEQGAYTGEVSAAMLTSAGCEYVILGHSERRGYYGETNSILLEKIKIALAVGLKVIYCCGESLDERRSGTHFKIIEEEIKSVLFPLSDAMMHNVVVAYEPIWAIGTGETATKEQAQEIHAFIRTTLRERFGEMAEEISILYGGSCKPSNAKELFAQEDIDGGLIGGASLKANDFLEIAKSF